MNGSFREIRVSLGSGESVLVRRWGEGGIPLLLIHGFLGGAGEWGDLPLGLATSLDVAAVDLPGHGGSDGGSEPGRYAVPRVAGDLAAVQEALFGGPAWWLGYSMGGRIALAAAAEGVSLRGLLLESASPGIRDSDDRARRRALDEERARRIETLGMTGFVSEWLELPLFAGLRGLPSGARTAARRLREQQDAGRMAAWLRGGGTGSQPSYWGALKELRLPVRFLAGSEDHRFVEIGRKVTEGVRDGELTVLPGVRHLPHLEAPQAWTAWVLASTGVEPQDD